MTSRLATAVANDTLLDQDYVEPAILQQETEGIRDDNGEWLQGATVETIIQLVSVPSNMGQERIPLQEGIRDEDLRTFFWKGDIRSLRYDSTDGDVIIPGKLGRQNNSFRGQNITSAELMRDRYGVENSAWLTHYQRNPGNLIRVKVLGNRPIYQNYDETEGHWVITEMYRAAEANRWGAFTEVMGIRINPGNIIV